MADVDAGDDSIWGGYKRLLDSRETPPRRLTPARVGPASAI